MTAPGLSEDQSYRPRRNVVRRLHISACRPWVGRGELLDSMNATQQIGLLLVDDRPENLLALEAILDLPDYRLVTAFSGSEALAKAAKDEFALILLDVAMPKMSGFEVAERLKRDERTRYIPILFVTAVATGMDDIYHAYETGAVDYLIKPLEVRAVQSKVRVFADLYRQRKQIEHQAALLHEKARREHELQLAEIRMASDERYRKLVDGIDHGFGWSSDAEANRLSFMSRQASELLGYPLAQFTEPGFFLDHVPPEERDAVRGAFVETAKEGRDHSVLHRFRTGDGTLLWFHTGVSASLEPVTGNVELHGMSVDVTSVKRAEEVAAKAARARDEVLEVVSHDLRTPLSSVLMHAREARKALATKQSHERVPDWIDRIERAARAMSRLVDDLTAFDQLKMGRLSLDRQPREVTALLAEAVAVLEPLARSKSIALRIDAEPAQGVRVFCDRDRIYQVLFNLIGNALKFSTRGAEVAIEARLDGDAVRFAVKDAGIGIERGKLPRVFDRNWQAEDIPGQARGLGLTIAQAIVELHDGHIWVRSEPGEGSTFSFTLPRVATQRQAAAPSGC